MNILLFFSSSLSKLSLIIILPSTNSLSSEYTGLELSISLSISKLIEYKFEEYFSERIFIYLFFQLTSLFLSSDSPGSNWYVIPLHILIISEKLSSSTLLNISFSLSLLIVILKLFIVSIKSDLASFIGLK